MSRSCGVSTSSSSHTSEQLPLGWGYGSIAGRLGSCLTQTWSIWSCRHRLTCLRRSLQTPRWGMRGCSTICGARSRVWTTTRHQDRLLAVPLQRERPSTRRPKDPRGCHSEHRALGRVRIGSGSKKYGSMPPRRSSTPPLRGRRSSELGSSHNYVKKRTGDVLSSFPKPAPILASSKPT